MPHPDELHWDRRYANELPANLAARPPHRLLVEHLSWLPATGLAVDMACGTGATGRFLAQKGWKVIGLDVSRVALQLSLTQAHQSGLELAVAQMDLLDPWLPPGHFDAILNFYFLSRPLFSTYRAALKPGGLLFFETYLWHPAVSEHPEHYLRPQELEHAFADWQILHIANLHRPLGPGSQSRQVQQFIVRKP